MFHHKVKKTPVGSGLSEVWARPFFTDVDKGTTDGILASLCTGTQCSTHYTAHTAHYTHQVSRWAKRSRSLTLRRL